MYFANFAISLLKTCSLLRVVERRDQEPEDVRDLPVFIFLSLSFTKDYSVLFPLLIFFNYKVKQS